jgi:hypothetical protein
MCKFIILAVVLYVCEIWSLGLRETQRLRMFENNGDSCDHDSEPSRSVKDGETLD